MKTGLLLNSGYMLTADSANKAIDGILKTIKKELPEEAQTYEGYKAILEQAKERLEELKPTI